MLTAKELLGRAQALEPQLVEWRRTLHRHPEVGFDLTQTKALVKKAEGGKFGARDLRRVIRKAVEDPAAERLIDGTLASGGTLVVDADENGEVVLK